MVLKLILLVFFLTITIVSNESLTKFEFDLPDDGSQSVEVLYLPNGEGLEFVSFGYKNFLADILWFNTINYFGKHFRSDHNYTWLMHMCGLVTTLDPRAAHAYEFCSLMLAWEGEDPHSAVKILDKAVKNNPDDWKYYYLRGITFAFFFREEELARQNFVKGSQKPGAPPFLMRLAAKETANLDNPQTAIAFLIKMIENAQDDNQRKVLVEHLDKMINEVNLKVLNTALNRYIAEYGRLPDKLGELRTEAGEQFRFEDPFGGRYILNRERRKIESTSSVERIRLFRQKEGDQ